MRTPEEAFESMCSCHGEIWTLTETGSVRTTKDEYGNTITSTTELMPLEIYDLLKATNLSHAYRHWLWGDVEVLVLANIKDKLEQEHTKAQLLAEHDRAETEEKNKAAYLKGAMERKIGRIKSQVEAFVKSQLKEQPGQPEQLDDIVDAILRNRPPGEHTVN